jgi:uncharacterized protein YndB with AHSA1/START domain
MDETLQTTNTSLTLSRVLKAPPEEVWELWTDPEKISQWHRPNTKDFTTEAEADAKVGGEYRIAMKSAEGTHTAFGKFKELTPPRKLVYSWQWESDSPAEASEVSEVTVLLEPVPEGTKLTLVHDRLSGPQSVKAHADGWLGCMENIKELIK